MYSVNHLITSEVIINHNYYYYYAYYALLLCMPALCWHNKTTYASSYIVPLPILNTGMCFSI